MNILITGATGFIGSHLLKKLLSLNHKIVVLKRTVSNIHRIERLLDKVVVYDIDRLYSFDKIFSDNKVDVIIHLSAMYRKKDVSKSEKYEMDKVNIKIPYKLLESACKFKVKGFINTGTFFEYDLQTDKLIGEESPIVPYNYHTITKIVFERILNFFVDSRKIKGITLKLFSPYGENDNDKIIPLIIKSFLNQKRLGLTKGNQKLAFTYINDIVNAYILAIKYINNQKTYKYNAFNIGNNKSYSLKKIVKIVKKISKKSGKVEFGKIHNLIKDESLNVKCDAGKARSILKWSAKTDIRLGLENTYLYYKNLYKL